MNAMTGRMSANGRFDKIRDDLQALSSDVAKLTQEIPSMLSEAGDESLRAARARVGRIKENIDTSLSQLGDRGRDAARAVNEAGSDVVDNLDDLLRTRPVATIAIAFGLGFLIGSALRRS
jgi:ElaB/YqjD/DUF883 family membrane-anchored ribosome-binding protein